MAHSNGTTQGFGPRAVAQELLRLAKENTGQEVKFEFHQGKEFLFFFNGEVLM